MRLIYNNHTRAAVAGILVVCCFAILISACDPGEERGGGKRDGDNPPETSSDSLIEPSLISVNIYVENSGSMAGYCDVKDTSAIETLIQDYYDRLDGSDEIDTVGLNYINTLIIDPGLQIKDFTKSIKGRCTAPYTKLDDMLEMMMDGIKDNCVNILISDYVFTSNDGNLVTAASGITKQFSRQLREKDLAVAIFKYMVDFKGKYYPGGIACNKPLPLYVWVFGNKEDVRTISQLPFTTKNCGTYFMQKSYDADYKLDADSERTIKGNKMHVSKWRKDRRGGFYEFTFTTKLNKVLLSKDSIVDASNYKIETTTATEYEIHDIEDLGEDTYKFTVRTVNSKPAPGQLTISYPIITPEWVAASNYESDGVPADSTTYGVSYLINGVSKAFADTSKNNNNYFTITINLVK